MAFPARLTVLENLTVFARIYNVREPLEKIIELLERFGIAHLKEHSDFAAVLRRDHAGRIVQGVSEQPGTIVAR